MLDLHQIQTQAYEQLSSEGVPCFLRICKSGDAIWVSDFPRRARSPSYAEEKLHALGLCCALHPETRLWYIDLSPALYEALEQTLPTLAPAFPEDESLYPAYSLCRLLLAHPCSLHQQPMELVRAILKWTLRPEQCALSKMLFETCALLLRQKRPLPHLAGRLLAHWLNQKGEPSCCSNT